MHRQDKIKIAVWNVYNIAKSKKLVYKWYSNNANIFCLQSLVFHNGKIKAFEIKIINK